MGMKFKQERMNDHVEKFAIKPLENFFDALNDYYEEDKANMLKHCSNSMAHAKMIEDAYTSLKPSTYDGDFSQFNLKGILNLNPCQQMVVASIMQSFNLLVNE